tara:strand:+ start:1667 stop:1897 length:231 start_codon:yes stop_codon:yes gene_type:complete
MPQFTLTCTDEDSTITIKEFEATLLNEVVEKTQDFLKGVGYVFEDLEVNAYVDEEPPTALEYANNLNEMLDGALHN